MKQQKFILKSFAFLFLLIVGCANDESLLPEDILSEQQEIYETVNPSEVEDFFNQNLTFSSVEGSTNSTSFATPLMEEIASRKFD